MRQLPPELKRRDPAPAERPGPGGPILPFLLILVLLFAGGISISYLLFPSPTAPVIPYSTFLAEAEAGRVERVTIREQRVEGLLRPETREVTPPPVSRDAETVLDEVAEAGWSSGAFETTIPSGDLPYVIDLLDRHGAVVEVAESEGSPLRGLLLLVPPALLLAGLLMYRRRTTEQSEDPPPSTTTMPIRTAITRRPSARFNDVAGEEEAKAQLTQAVDFLRSPGKYREVGARLPRGVLLVGPPGTGKTLLAKAVAGEAGVAFFSVSASEFVEMFVGVGASRVRDLFERARHHAPAVIFIDELDAVGRRREAGLGNGNDERDQTLNQLLVEMDGFERHQNIVVLAASNRPDVLDPALLRPGRFDRQAVLGLPDRAARERILQVHTRGIRIAEGVDLSTIAEATPGMSGAELANLVNEAALIAARDYRLQVEQADFERALDKVTLGVERPIVLTPAERHVLAYHEAAHALLACILPSSDPVRKVTILPRGRSLGMTVQTPREERFNVNRAQLEARICVLLAGFAAERLVFNDVTTGAADDLKQATSLTRRMIGLWGMSDEIGPIFLGSGETHEFLDSVMMREQPRGEAISARVDRAVTRQLMETVTRATELLQNNREQLDRLAAALIAEETLDGDRVLALVASHESQTDDSRMVAVADG